jgi:DNA-binding CsgD family transcriptional regulator
VTPSNGKAHYWITARVPVGNLTDTECRIAGLVAQGKTNREVASAMYVRKTWLQTHVRHIFQKLGVGSRAELTAQLLSASADARTALRSPESSDPCEFAVTVRHLGHPLSQWPVLCWVHQHHPYRKSDC